jgi:PAS domain S-box-containing protein
MKSIRLLPKYLLIGVVLATLSAGATTTILYLVYRDALFRVVNVAVDTNRGVLTDQVGGSETDVMGRLAAQLASAVAQDNETEIQKLLKNALRDSGAGLILVRGADGQVLQHVGDLGLEAGVGGGAQRGGERLTMTAPLVHDTKAVGTLLQVFDAGGLLATNAELGRRLAVIREEAQRTGVLRLLGFGAIAMLAIGLLAAFMAWRQARVIRALVTGAEKLSEGDYAVQLPTERSDELGQLARSFESMRDRLQTTTVSRNYLDQVIGNMADAIILTSADERIIRTNAAVQALLGYTESELIGRSVRDVLAPGERASLKIRGSAQRDQEILLLTKDEQPVPVALSASALPGSAGQASGFVVSARNISERKAAEQRIRYLARTDSLTKVPNRMQFQHLLQRAIARSRRSKQRLSAWKA